MKRIKKVVDERQELELLKIEHVVLWIMFWALFASFIVQSWFLDAPFEQFAPELAVFLICCVGIIIGSVRKGQWDFYTQPTMKTYAISAAIGAVVFSVLYAVSRYLRDDYYKDEPVVLIITAAIMAVLMFALIFGAIALVGHMVKKKREKLADEYSDDEDDQ